MSNEMNTVDYISAALALVGVAVKLYPELAHWLGDLTSGRVDPISLRVKDILPEESASRRAQREIGG